MYCQRLSCFGRHVGIHERDANIPIAYISLTVKPGQAFCPGIKIWFCCSKFEFILRSNFSTLNRKTDFSSQALISIIKFASITEQ